MVKIKVTGVEWQGYGPECVVVEMEEGRWRTFDDEELDALIEAAVGGNGTVIGWGAYSEQKVAKCVAFGVTGSYCWWDHQCEGLILLPTSYITSPGAGRLHCEVSA